MSEAISVGSFFTALVIVANSLPRRFSSAFTTTRTPIPVLYTVSSLFVMYET